MPLMDKPATVTVLPVPTFLVSNVALVLAKVTVSPVMMSVELPVAIAAVVPS